MSGTTRDVVRVSAKGQATIPKQLREKFGIETPGRVRFRESEAGEIVVSRTVRDLVVGSELRFTHRGEHELKGIEEPWQLYAVA